MVWNLNEDTNVFWSDISTLEDNGFFDPWYQKIDLRMARKIRNSVNEIIEYHLVGDIQGYPIDIVIVNE